MSETTELHNGKWLPAVPLPWYSFLHVRCWCGKRFWKEAAYRRHYITYHLRRDPRDYEQD